MATVAFTSFLPEVMVECDSVPQILAINAIRNACFDFCRDTLFWREDGATTNYTADTAEYVLTPLTDTQIVSVLSLRLDDESTIYPVNRKDVQDITEAGDVTSFFQPAPDTIHLVKTPQEDGAFVPTVAYAPARDATTVDRRLFDLFLETIKHGVLWKLQAMANKPWSDPGSSQYHKAMFEIDTKFPNIDRNMGDARAGYRAASKAFV